jgi:hypothetical protein
MKPTPLFLSVVLLACVQISTASAQAVPPVEETDWGRIRRDVDTEARRLDGDFEARRQAILERARARFNAADTNGDKLLSREEMTKLRPGMAQHFDRFDSNGDGQVSEQEIGDAIRKRQQMHSGNRKPPPGGEEPKP